MDMGRQLVALCFYHVYKEGGIVVVVLSSCCNSVICYFLLLFFLILFPFLDISPLSFFLSLPPQIVNTSPYLLLNHR